MLRLPQRALVRLEGAETLALLERTITLTTRDWSDGTWRYGALLTPQGKIIADFLAKQDKGAIQIDVHADAADDLITRIKRLRLRAAINIDLCTDLIPVTCENGAPDPRHADLPRRILIPAAEQSLATDMIAAQWSRLRLCAGVPEWGADYRAEELFPTDVNMDVMGGIDYRKGCFIGQEVASRMKRKGGIRKRTVRVSGPTVAKGKTLNAPNEIGTITSAEGHDALALVRIDRLARVSEPILCDGEPAELHIPDWLGAEIAAFKGDGNVTV